MIHYSIVLHWSIFFERKPELNNSFCLCMTKKLVGVLTKLVRLYNSVIQTKIDIEYGQ